MIPVPARMIAMDAQVCIVNGSSNAPIGMVTEITHMRIPDTTATIGGGIFVVRTFMVCLYLVSGSIARIFHEGSQLLTCFVSIGHRKERGF
jgi:hypothetical protein